MDVYEKRGGGLVVCEPKQHRSDADRAVRWAAALSVAVLMTIASCDNTADLGASHGAAMDAPAEAPAPAPAPAPAEAPAPSALFLEAANTSTVAEALNLARASALLPNDGLTHVVVNEDLVAARHVAVASGGVQVTAYVFRFGSDGSVSEQWVISQPQTLMAVAEDELRALTADDQVEVSNGAVVIDFLGAALNEGRRSEVMSALVHPSIHFYGATSHVGLEAYARQFDETHPSNAAYDVRALVRQKDLVASVALMLGGPESTVVPTMVFDLFQLQDGRITNHWEVMQSIGN